MKEPREINTTNLSTATAQEVFDWIAWNLIKQGKPSMTGKFTCRYRGPDGLKCAAGFCIPDNIYNGEAMEGTGWDGLIEQGLVPIDHEVLIEHLQGAHDLAANQSIVPYLKRLKALLKRHAMGHKLNTKILGNEFKD